LLTKTIFLFIVRFSDEILTPMGSLQEGFDYDCHYCIFCIKRGIVTTELENSFTEYPLNPWYYPIYAPLWCLCSANRFLTKCCIPCCLNTGCTEFCMSTCYADLLGKECFWDFDRASFNEPISPQNFCCECVKYRDDLCCCLNFRIQRPVPSMVE
jgi:hypothetical protein